VSEEQRNIATEPESQGAVPGESRPRRPRTTTTVSPKDEKTWSILAHVSIFLNLFTGLLGPVGAFVIWLMYKDRSPRISFHALQALWYQVAWLVILAVGWTVTGLLTVIIIGFLLIPVMIVLTLVPFVHMSYAAYKVSQGVDYRYLWVADMVSSNRKLGS
jgi:uncharacterized Tic20 family protein